ncbi:MAG: glycosyltransferase family 4 protein [Acidimicrobiales bacterium]
MDRPACHDHTVTVRSNPVVPLSRGEDRLSVGIIAPPWLPVPPRAYGGTENVIDILGRGLDAAGVGVVLVTTGDATCPVPRKWVFPMAIGVGNGGAADEACHVIGAYEMLRDVDIIHDHTMVGPLYSRGIDSPPVVTTNHGPFNEILTPIYRALSPTVPVIAISNHQASEAVGVSIAAVILHGIDVERVPFGTGGGGYAAFLGRMHPDKGIEEAIAAAQAAGMRLRIAAKMTEPFEREYFTAHVAPHIGGGIEFIGELGRTEKYDFLKEATCLLNPIRWAEPFGMVMIEALACGTPIVANDRGSVSEIVDDRETGYLCRDFGSLTRALQRVGDLDRSHCRAVAEQRFSSRRMVEEHIGLYRRTIENNRDCPETARRPAVGETTGLERSTRGHRSRKTSQLTLPT